MSKGVKKEQAPFQYKLTDKGEFIIENYNFAQKMPSFLPGISGTLGIPMWVFYVNRAQGITSFGIDGKDSSIVEFFSANRSYQLVPSIGFRTFYRVNGKDFYEPFQRTAAFDSQKVVQKMIINSYDLGLEEVNHISGLESRVNYFTIPNEPVGALARVLTIKNLNKKPVSVQILDGLPQIVSYGLIHIVMKDLTNLTEAWVQVENVNERNPFFKLSCAVKDKPQVEILNQGNFYFTKPMGKKGGFSPIIIDPVLIFGSVESFLFPDIFLRSKNFQIPRVQRNRNLFPCSFSYNEVRLKPQEEISFVTMAGNARTYDILKDFKEKCSDPAYVMDKKKENKTIIRQMQDNIMTVSSEEKFDAYTRQTYLDNVLRGGYPYSIKTEDRPAIFHIYSRRHGDLERDYNRFKLLPTYFSQGNGNYRDVNQNRRNDIRFNPDTGKSTIRTFMNLTQLDGYNPLIIKGSHFWVEDERKADELAHKCSFDNTGSLKGFLMRNFTPGDLLIFLEEEGIKLKVDREVLLAKVLSSSKRMEDAEFGEGFWSDHWHYNLDLIESYLSIYPERARELFFDEKTYSFYENMARVMPRHEKSFLTSLGVRQYHSVYEDEAKRERLEKRPVNPFAIRKNFGKGDVYLTNLFVKFVTIAINKAATLDPSGMGIELESNKPNWYDALNGLPGLFGSSLSETYELKRMLLLLKRIIEKEQISLTLSTALPEEVASFLHDITFLLKDKELSDLDYWDGSHTVKEKYREKTINGISGKEVVVEIKAILKFFDLVLEKLEKGIRKAQDKTYSLPLTYFSHEVTDYEVLSSPSHGEDPKVRPKKFQRHSLPLFLEGSVHAMRSETDPAKVLALHKAVTASPIFDNKLKMYKINVSLADESYEIGRTKIFPEGWLENESIWLHMEYKYLLELLKAGLYDEFYKITKTTLIPYLDSRTYGRSILENSSFIVSSAYYDKTIHGRGFAARLSGSTAEFIHMWLLMVVGAKPFTFDAQGHVVLRFKPALPGSFFTRMSKDTVTYDNDGCEYELHVPKNSFAFKFLGSIPVVYNNPRRLDTWDPRAGIRKIQVETEPGKHIIFDGDTISGDLCRDIRDRKVVKIEVEIN